jgi:hypothetical protein
MKGADININGCIDLVPESCGVDWMVVNGEDDANLERMI